MESDWKKRLMVKKFSESIAPKKLLWFKKFQSFFPKKFLKKSFVVSVNFLREPKRSRKKSLTLLIFFYCKNLIFVKIEISLNLKTNALPKKEKSLKTKLFSRR